MVDPRSSLEDVIASARALLEEELATGGIGIPIAAPRRAPEISAEATRARAPEVAPLTSLPIPARPATASAATASAEPPSLESATPRTAARASVSTFGTVAGPERSQHLHVLAERAASCTSCGLHAGRNKSVFARGSNLADLVFVGEGPGRDEDAQGLPFVGAAGQLLDKMIAAMGYGRDDVYICNVVKCRPPENRTPLPNEAAACEPFLTAQLEIVAPKVIVALGKCAALNLGVASETGRWRGLWKTWRGVPVMPTYHPAFLLRSPERKRDVWEDLQLVMEKLGKPLPKARG